MPPTTALPQTARSPPASSANRSPAEPYQLGFPPLNDPPATPSPALAHEPFTNRQHVQLRTQILVHADLIEGKPPAETTMLRAFGEPGNHKHAWEEALHVAVDKLQNQRSPMTGLETPVSSWIGSCTAEQGSKDTAASKTIIAESHSSKIHPNSSQHDGGEKLSQDLNDDSARIQRVKKDSGHDELALRTADVSPSVSCNGAIQEDKSETNHPPVNTTEHTKIFEQQNGDEAHLEVSDADRFNRTLYDDGNILKNKTVCGGQTDSLVGRLLRSLITASWPCMIKVQKLIFYPRGILERTCLLS